MGDNFIVGLILLFALSMFPANTTAQKSKTQPNKIPKTQLPELSAKMIAQKALPSVVLLVCDNTKEAAQGSGFFIRPGIVVTNYHVIKGMTRGVVQVAIGAKKEKRNFRIARILAFDEISDLALLSVPAAKEFNIPSLDLVPIDKPLEVGETIYALGNPEGLVGTISPGIVSANIRSTEKKARIQITAPISSGSSGGPVVNSRGLVLGVAVGSLTEGQNLNFAVPTSLILDLIKNAKAPSELESFLDEVRDKDTKIPADWAWSDRFEQTPRNEDKKPPIPKSVIGGVRPGETLGIASLRKLEGIYVVVEEIDYPGNRFVSNNQLKTEIELRLRRNGIKVITREEWNANEKSGCLYLNVAILQGTNSGLISYSYSLELKQIATLDRDQTFFITVSTWEKGGIGLSSPTIATSSIKESISEITDEFCNDFLKANAIDLFQ